MPTSHFSGHASVGWTLTSRWSKLLMERDAHFTQTPEQETSEKTVSERKAIWT
jgi:hypothetical protein